MLRTGLAVAGLTVLVVVALPTVTGDTTVAPPALPLGPAPATTALPPTVNLLAGDQAVFSASTGGWVPISAALSWLPGPGDAAPGSLQLTAANRAGMGAASGTPAAGGATPAMPGTLYAGSVAAIGPASRSVEPLLDFYASSGALLTAVFGSQTPVGPGAWIRARPVAALAPAGAAFATLQVDVPTTAPGDRVDIDDAWLVGTPPSSGAVDGPLRTSGNRIVQADGVPVVLRGMVLDGLESDPDAPQVTERSVIEAKAWGANVVRLPLGEQFWLSSNCDYDPDYAATVDQVVRWITSLGMVALLDLHTTTAGGCEPGGVHNMADQAQSPRFWSAVAARYGALTSPEYNSLVAFDLFNEPHGITDAQWLDGGTTTDDPGSQTYRAAGMQQLYDAVRATGAANLVFVSGNQWANDIPDQLVAGTGIVYEAHIYTCPVVAPPTCDSSAPYDPSTILLPWVSLARQHPVMVTEFGWPSLYDGRFNQAVVGFAHAHGLGWTAFAWGEPDHVSGFDLAADWLADGTAEPSASGMPVLCGLFAGSSGRPGCAAPPFPRGGGSGN